MHYARCLLWLPLALVSLAATAVADVKLPALFTDHMVLQRDQPVPVWEQLIETTLTHLRRTSRKGFSVNFVHVPASKERARTGLYCTTPTRWSQFCEMHLSSHVRVVDDYGMGEFTLLVEPLSDDR